MQKVPIGVNKPRKPINQRAKNIKICWEKQSQIAPDAIGAEWAEKCRYGIGWTHFSEATLSKDSAEQQKHYQAAVSAWKEGLANHPNGALADKTQYHIGIAYVNLKQYDDGIQAFKQILS